MNGARSGKRKHARLLVRLTSAADTSPLPRASGKKSDYGFDFIPFPVRHSKSCSYT